MAQLHAVGRNFGETAVCDGEYTLRPVFALHPGMHLIIEEILKKNVSKGIQRIPSSTVLGTISCVNLATIL
jgi:hypothetical protein